ncbi:MAG: hypothetical protein FWF25_01315 [Propionibacteriaceae bacterium]|nr:hypothetical protein [Propionibacteriaceae bacterium]
MIRVELMSPHEKFSDGYYVAATLTLCDDGHLEVDDPEHIVYSAHPHIEGLLETSMLVKDETGAVKRLTYADDPAYWLRNLRRMLRTGYLIPVTVVDTGQGELTRDQVCQLLGIRPDTWSGYVSRGQAPQPIRHVGSTPVWSSDQVERWQGSRQGRGKRRTTLQAAGTEHV